MKCNLKRKKTGTLFFAFVLLLIVSCEQRQDSISIVNLDYNGNETTLYVPKIPFNKALTPLITKVGAETMMGLESIKKDGPWDLEKVEVGLAVGANLNLGLVKAGVTPGLRLILKKK